MVGIDENGLETELMRHYAAQREAPAAERLYELACLMTKEGARVSEAPARRLGDAGFVAAQVRFVPPWSWGAQLVIVTLMVWSALSCGNAAPVRWAVGLMSAASVLVCVPPLFSSSQHGVIELECACRYNAARVLAARLIVLGCSCALAVALMVAGTSVATGIGALSVTLWACPPYFCSCAGTLAILRRARTPHAVVSSIAWIAVICSALLAISIAFPGIYGPAALAIWGLAAAAALAWLVREALLALRSAAGGLDSFAPHIASTCN